MLAKRGANRKQAESIARAKTHLFNRAFTVVSDEYFGNHVADVKLMPLDERAEHCLSSNSFSLACLYCLSPFCPWM